MKIRRLTLDVDKALSQPSLFDIAEAIDKVQGVKGFNISVAEIDLEKNTLSGLFTVFVSDYARLRGDLSPRGARAKFGVG